MKKTFKMQDLDCAACGAKIEAAIKKINGVQFARVNFMTQRLVLEYDEVQFDIIKQSIANACKKIEPDCKIIF